MRSQRNRKAPTLQAASRVQHPVRVKVTNEQTLVAVVPEELKRGVRAALEHGNCPRGKLHLLVVNDARSRAMNQRFLQHDYATDVITFPLTIEPGFVEADILISAETAARSAGELGVAPQDEILLYAVHGALHLMGFDDTSPESAKAMRQAESEVFMRMGKPFPVDRGAQDCS